MSPPPVSRRAFLTGSAGAALAVAAVGTSTSVARALVATAAPAAKKAISPLVLSSDLHASPDSQRFVFAIARGAKFASFGPAQVVFAPPEGTAGTILDTNLYEDGLPRGRGIYVTDAVFPVAGIYKAAALVRGTKVPFAVQVKEKAEAPLPGSAAPTAPSPTPTDTLGVDPICTRTPKCPLHDVSLSDVIGKGQPVAVMFATPALCQSQYCGPVLDELLDVRGPYEQRGVRFVHVEIYESNRGATVAPTVEAWGLPSEPWLFTVDGAGIIQERLDGAFATNEVTAALDRLVD
jgi:hypothetical protein